MKLIGSKEKKIVIIITALLFFVRFYLPPAKVSHHHILTPVGHNRLWLWRESKSGALIDG